jgi:hypothetical protein
MQMKAMDDTGKLAQLFEKASRDVFAPSRACVEFLLGV